MRKTLTAAVLMGLVSTGLMTSAPAEAVARRQTVNRAEFRAVHQGMTMRRVHQIFGAYGVAYTGRQTFFWDEIDADSCAFGDTDMCAEQDREYRVSTSSYGSAEIEFYRAPAGTWRVASKHVFW